MGPHTKRPSWKESKIVPVPFKLIYFLFLSCNSLISATAGDWNEIMYIGVSSVTGITKENDPLTFEKFF